MPSSQVSLAYTSGAVTTTLTEPVSWSTGFPVLTATFYQVSPFPVYSYSVASGPSLKFLSGTTLGATIQSTSASTTSISSSLATTSISSSLPTSILSSSTTNNPSTLSTSALPESTAKERHNAGVSSGAAAGIGIGCAIAGALLAAIGVCFLMRRRRSHGRPTAVASANIAGKSSGYSSRYDNDDGAVALRSMPASAINRLLPQPLDDNTIGREFSKLGTALKNHAQTYYASGGDNVATADTSAIHRLLGSGSSLESGTIADLLAHTDTRVSATRYLLGWPAIQRIDNDLLPPGVAACMSGMTGLTNDPKGRAALLGQWRAISALLMHNDYGQAQLSQNDVRVQRANELADTLDNVLRPFASTRYSHDERISNLRGVIQRAVRFGFVLFSQPSSWDFDWNISKEDSNDHVVVFPALMQVADEQGTVFARPRLLVQKELAYRRYSRLS